MKIKINSIIMLLTIAVCFFWDILDGIMNNLPLVVIAGIFLIFFISGKKIKVSSPIILIFAFILIHGLINVMFHNTDIIVLITQFLAIFICYIVFYNITIHCDLSTFFKIYFEAAFIMSVIAVIQECVGIFGFYSIKEIPVISIFAKNYGELLFMVKVFGLFREPSFLAYFLCPSVFFALAAWFLPEKMPLEYSTNLTKFKAIIMILAYLFTFSLTGYIGLIVMFVMIWYAKGISLAKGFLPVLAIVIAYVVYRTVPDIQVRIDDTLRAFLNMKNTMDYDSINLSSFTFYANYKVMKDSLLYTNFLGAGLGGCSIMYDLFNIGGWSDRELMFNREDANSMLFRILIEFGILGVIVVCIFLKKFFLNKDSKMYLYSASCFALFCILLLRQGNYTHGGIILFMCFYYKAYLINRQLQKDNKIEMDCIETENMC